MAWRPQGGGSPCGDVRNILFDLNNSKIVDLEPVTRDLQELAYSKFQTSLFSDTIRMIPREFLVKEVESDMSYFNDPWADTDHY